MKWTVLWTAWQQAELLRSSGRSAMAATAAALTAAVEVQQLARQTFMSQQQQVQTKTRNATMQLLLSRWRQLRAARQT
jgi:hypothetical protein